LINFLSLLTKKSVYIPLLCIFAFLYHSYSLHSVQSKANKEIASLNQTITSFTKAQEEARIKQEEYINSVYTNLTNQSKEINEQLTKQKDEIDSWSSTLINDITNGVSDNISGEIRKSRATELEATRASLRNTAELLQRKFSKEVSTNLVRLISDAEKNRVALAQCIAFYDKTKNEIEGNNSSLPLQKEKKKNYPSYKK